MSNDTVLLLLNEAQCEHILAHVTDSELRNKVQRELDKLRETRNIEPLTKDELNTLRDDLIESMQTEAPCQLTGDTTSYNTKISDWFIVDDKGQVIFNWHNGCYPVRLLAARRGWDKRINKNCESDIYNVRTRALNSKVIKELKKKYKTLK